MRPAIREKKRKVSATQKVSLLFDNRHVRLISWSKPIRDSEGRNAHSVKERLFFSSKNGINSFAFSSCRFTRATSDKRTESGTNPRYSFGLYGADRLSARTGAAGCSRSRDTVIHSAGRYSEESSRIHRGINNISVKSCEKYSNSVKATDIRTNATDVETRRNIVQ